MRRIGTCASVASSHCSLIDVAMISIIWSLGVVRSAQQFAFMKFDMATPRMSALSRAAGLIVLSQWDRTLQKSMSSSSGSGLGGSGGGGGAAGIGGGSAIGVEPRSLVFFGGITGCSGSLCNRWLSHLGCSRHLTRLLLDDMRELFSTSASRRRLSRIFVHRWEGSQYR